MPGVSSSRTVFGRGTRRGRGRRCRAGQDTPTSQPASPHRGVYNLLPEELLCLERTAEGPGDTPLPPTQANGWLLDEEAERGSCSSHFFWLEVLYDFHSSRHASHLAEPSATGSDGEGAVFELLEREPSSVQA
mmetsp:Transcript_61003/g.196524  ORF Transcript_61003/g.196524 Transcript_61003/m.196524 type:complete len:133 (-) Transcript_61003:348-746(-)